MLILAFLLLPGHDAALRLEGLDYLVLFADAGLDADLGELRATLVI